MASSRVRAPARRARHLSVDEPTIEWLLAQQIVSPALAQYLADYRFDGDIVGYLEGEVFTSLSPVLRLKDVSRTSCSKH